MLQVANGPKTDERLGDAVDRDGGHHAHIGRAPRLKDAAQHQAVDHGGDHPDIVGLGPLDAPFLTKLTLEDVAAAHDHSDLHTQAMEIQQLVGDMAERMRVEAPRIIAGDRAAAELDEDTLVAHEASVLFGYLFD